MPTLATEGEARSCWTLTFTRHRQHAGRARLLLEIFVSRAPSQPVWSPAPSGSARGSAFGHLRFAGTVPPGLVAATLGLGALAAPLVGWRDWPAGLSMSGSA